ncbi:hypothetical protein ZIOFF_059859 [Zingiber officinale]|uniref:Uncharacterized protein n=1 Tax=Zingiber officinale TaxID=94328 RepID=A0A8J5F9Z1_ZINOF|nr:hypothetical protein ZIOFF_059859 [Zingiber officinale]
MALRLRGTLISLAPRLLDASTPRCPHFLGVPSLGCPDSLALVSLHSRGCLDSKEDIHSGFDDAYKFLCWAFGISWDLLILRLVFLQGSQRIEAKPLSQDSHEVQSKNQNHAVVKAPGQDPGPSFIVHSNNKKISVEDIKLLEPLWQKLEEENSDFFRAYYIRLKLKKQIILFNQFLQHQYHLMKFPISPKVPLAPIRNGSHPRPVDDLQIGYPVFQPPIPDTLQLHIGPTSFGLPSCQANNGTLAPSTSHPGQMNNDEPSKAAVASACQCKAMPSMPEMAATPEPVASNDHLRFAPPEIPMGPDASAADTTFTSDIDLEFSRDSLRSLGNKWNFSLSDLTNDLTNLGELGDTGDYSGSPILPSDKDIFRNDTDRDAIGNEISTFFDLLLLPRLLFYFHISTVRACSAQ